MRTAWRSLLGSNGHAGMSLLWALGETDAVLVRAEIILVLIALLIPHDLDLGALQDGKLLRNRNDDLNGASRLSALLKNDSTTRTKNLRSNQSNNGNGDIGLPVPAVRVSRGNDARNERDDGECNVEARI